jgi:hypothetical protein
MSATTSSSPLSLAVRSISTGWAWLDIRRTTSANEMASGAISPKESGSMPALSKQAACRQKAPRFGYRRMRASGCRSPAAGEECRGKLASASLAGLAPALIEKHCAGTSWHSADAQAALRARNQTACRLLKPGHAPILHLGLCGGGNALGLR